MINSFDPIQDAICFSDRNEWREWLQTNHHMVKEIWIIYQKKKSRQKSVSYTDAVEEALCFGWIDSTVKSIDNDSYMQKFQPRKKNSKWSNLNKDRVIKMIESGQMTTFGTAKMDEAKANGNWENSTGGKSETPVIPDDLLCLLATDKTAYSNFMNFAPGYRNSYIYWINFSKKEETRKNRIVKVFEYSLKNKKPGMI
jgi:uncharacterized protein YdeI (YjbR/CyaY-like superfamily)